MIDRPRVRKQTKHYNSFEEDELMEFSELDSDSDERPTRSRRFNEKTRRYLRAECFRVEKNLLIFGSVLCSASLCPPVPPGPLLSLGQSAPWQALGSEPAFGMEGELGVHSFQSASRVCSCLCPAQS